MSVRNATPVDNVRPIVSPLAYERHRPMTYATMAADLQAALGREQVLIAEKRDLSDRQVMLTQEFEHRLVNSMQLISSLLSLQSRSARTPEAATQLIAASRRVSALGRVHRRLHLLDHQDNVELKRYLQLLCEDLSGLLFQEVSEHGLVVEGPTVEIPTKIAIPLGFIVNELITNAVKYARGNITVRLEKTSAGYSLSVLDDGPGLPAGFNPADNKGLGMTIVRSLVSQVSGELRISAGDAGRGTCFTIAF